MAGKGGGGMSILKIGIIAVVGFVLYRLYLGYAGASATGSTIVQNPVGGTYWYGNSTWNGWSPASAPNFSDQTNQSGGAVTIGRTVFPNPGSVSPILVKGAFSPVSNGLLTGGGPQPDPITGPTGVFGFGGGAVTPKGVIGGIGVLGGPIQPKTGKALF